MAGLAEAVCSWEAFRQETDEESGWEADDVQVVTLDALDERRAEALDRVPARAALPLTAAYVVRQVARRQRPERDHGRLAVQLLPRSRPQTQTRHDFVPPTRQPLEHRLGRTSIRRFPERLTVHDDLGVDAEHRALATVDRVRLPRRELDRIASGLLELRRNNLERSPQLLENCPPLRGNGRQDQWRSRRNAHPRLRAFQISSAGHLRAHSAETKP